MRVEQIGLATLCLGDNRECDQLRGHFALIADPPYGIGHVKGSGGLGKHDRRNIMPVYGDDQPFDPIPWLHLAKVTLLWGADHYADRLPHGRWLAWNKLGLMESYDSFLMSSLLGTVNAVLHGSSTICGKAYAKPPVRMKVAFTRRKSQLR